MRSDNFSPRSNDAGPAPGKTCPRCSRPLPADAPAGNCPSCLLALATGEEKTAGSAPPFLRLGDYELIEEIARGGMGIVWRARQVSLNRAVALKTILSGQLATAAQVLRFQTEARAAAGLDHPSIVPIYEIGDDEGQYFFSMKLMEGRSLAEQIGARRPAALTASIVAAIARAVHFAHQHGVLHRDLKPSNILLDSEGKPHVADFGLARLTDGGSDFTRTGALMGSPAYMAPEQAAGRAKEVTTAADIYSLGAILYELLTGRPPFAGESPLATLRAVVEQPPPRPRALDPAVDRDLEVIALKCLEKDPSRRYPSAAAMGEDLERWLSGAPILARRAGSIERARSWARRKPELAALAASLALALLAGGIGVLWQWGRAETHARNSDLQAYAADIFAASSALDRGELGMAQSLLERHLPRPGSADLRGFEWRHLWKACQGDEHIALRGHQWIVTRLAFSPDRRWIASASMDKTVKVWDAESGNRIADFIAGKGASWSVAFLPEGDLLVTGTSDGRIRFWDTRTWQPRPEEFPGQIAALSADGRILAAAEASPWYWIGKPGSITLWEWRAGKKLPSPPQPGRYVALAADGKTLAYAGDQKRIHLWDIAGAKSLGDLTCAGNPWTIEFSPDGCHLAVAGWPGSAEVWDWRAAERIADLRGHEGIVWSASFSPNGKTLITCASDQRVRVWETSRWSLETTLRGHRNEVWCAAFSSDGGRLATGGKDQQVLVWPIPPRPEPPPIQNRPFVRPLFSPDGKCVLTRVQRGNEERIIWWSLPDKKPLGELPRRSLAGFTKTGELCVYDPDSPAFEFWVQGAGEPARRVPASNPQPRGEPSFSSWSRERGAFLGGWSDGRAVVWDCASGRELAAWRASPVPLRFAVISPDGRWAALSPEVEIADNLYGAVLRNLDSGAERTLLGHRDLVQGLAFTPDSRGLATAGMDAAVKIWDVSSGAERVSLFGHLQDALAVEFSADGNLLASLGSGLDVKIWHLPTKRQVASLPVPAAGDHLTFSPDGRWLAVNTTTGWLRLFEGP